MSVRARMRAKMREKERARRKRSLEQHDRRRTSPILFGGPLRMRAGVHILCPGGVVSHHRARPSGARTSGAFRGFQCLG